ncbi:hypothetical protein HYQ46_003014 [Verticillium longisporum]|nr:hypothetical protein HYQ46_003014 [Verticillium longisporum]
MRRQLKTVSRPFFQFLKYCPRFRCSQKMALSPKVNHAIVVADEMERIESKMGMALEMTQTMTQYSVTQANQVPQDLTLRSVTWWVDSMARMATTYMYLMPVWPNAMAVAKTAGRTTP